MAPESRGVRLWAGERSHSTGVALSKSCSSAASRVCLPGKILHPLRLEWKSRKARCHANSAKHWRPA